MNSDIIIPIFIKNLETKENEFRLRIQSYIEANVISEKRNELIDYVNQFKLKKIKLLTANRKLDIKKFDTSGKYYPSDYNVQSNKTYKPDYLTITIPLENGKDLSFDNLTESVIHTASIKNNYLEIKICSFQSMLIENERYFEEVKGRGQSIINNIICLIDEFNTLINSFNESLINKSIEVVNNYNKILDNKNKALKKLDPLI